MTEETNATTVSEFDRLKGSLHGLPDVLNTKPSTITNTTLIGSETYIVETFRQPERGDTVFLQRVSSAGSMRIVLPPKVTAAIAKQRDALTAKSRSKAAKATAADRKARGITPAFLKVRNVA